MIQFIRKSIPAYVWGAFGIGLLAFLFKTCQHLGGHSYYWDLMFVDQAIWNFTHGHGLWVSMYHLPTFSDHFYPYFVLISPLYQLIETPLWLFGIQGFCVGMMAYPLLKLAYSHFGTKGSWLLAGYLFFYAPLRAGFIQDLHGELLMMPLIAWSLYFSYTKRFKTSFLLAMLILFTKESAILITLPLLVVIGIHSKHKKTCAVLILASLAMAFWVIGIFMPSFHTGAYAHWDKYSDLGTSFGHIVSNMVTHPQLVLSKLFSFQTLGYAVGLLLPFGFLPLRSLYLVTGLGLFLQNVLANSSTQMSNILNHCTLPFVPLVFFTFILCLSYQKQYHPQKWLKWKPRLTTLAIFCVGVNIILFIFTEARTFTQLPERYQAIQAIHRLIPDSASVAASGYLLPHFEYRTNITDQHGFEKADYVILDGLSTVFPRDCDAGAYIQTLWASKSYAKMFQTLIIGDVAPRHTTDPYVQIFDSIRQDSRFTLVYTQANIFCFKRKISSF